MQGIMYKNIYHVNIHVWSRFDSRVSVTRMWQHGSLDRLYRNGIASRWWILTTTTRCVSDSAHSLQYDVDVDVDGDDDDVDGDDGGE